MSGVVYSAMNGIQPALYGEMFPTRVRLSGMAIGTQIGFAIGGFAPTAAAAIDGDGTNWVPVAAYVLGLQPDRRDRRADRARDLQGAAAGDRRQAGSRAACPRPGGAGDRQRRGFLGRAKPPRRDGRIPTSLRTLCTRRGGAGQNGGVQVHELTDGGQAAEQVAEWVAAFLRPAKRTLELALYDIRLPGRAGDLVADELRAAAGRGVAVRLALQRRLEPPARDPAAAEHEAGAPATSSRSKTARCPGSPTSCTTSTSSAIARRCGPGRPTGRRTHGRARRTSSSPSTRRRSPPPTPRNFDELWERPDVGRSGRVEPAPVELGGGRTVRPWFTPGHGEQLSQRIATAIGCARRRVRIASPVITSAPVLATLAELGERGGVDVAGVIDEPQTDAVYGQWATNGTSAWKIPLLAKALEPAAVLGQAIDPVGAGDRPRLHAREGHRRRRRRLRRLVQPVALGGDERRERARDPRPRARRPDGRVRRRGPRRATRPRPVPSQAMATISAVAPRRPSGISKSARGDAAGVEQLRAHPVEQPRPVVARRRARPGGRSPPRSGSGS